jgi:predicted transcriptional regulator
MVFEIQISPELVERIQRLARGDERSRAAEIRWLLARAVELAEIGQLRVPSEAATQEARR